MKKLHFVAAAVLVFAVGSAFTATKFVAEPKANKTAYVNTYYVIGKSGSGSTAKFNLSSTAPGDCGTPGSDPCRITTNLTLTSPVLQSTVNDPSKVTIQDNHTLAP